MCEFLSGLTFGPNLESKYGKFYSDPAHVNSHTDLEAQLKLKDRHVDPAWAKWEYTPGTNGITDFEGYVFRLDEDRKPSWWTDEVESETIAYVKAQLAKVVLVSGKIAELREDVYALAGNVEVGALYSVVGVMRESAQVGVMWGSAQVGEMRQSAQVREMWESAQVGVMRESALATGRSPDVKYTLNGLAVFIDRSDYSKVTVHKAKARRVKA